MSNILDDYRAQHPRTWRDLFRRVPRPSALELASAALEQCRREQLDTAAQAEAYSAALKMLRERETRLLKDVARLSQRPAKAPGAPVAPAEPGPQGAEGDPC